MIGPTPDGRNDAREAGRTRPRAEVPRCRSEVCVDTVFVRFLPLGTWSTFINTETLQTRYYCTPRK